MRKEGRSQFNILIFQNTRDGRYYFDISTACENERGYLIVQQYARMGEDILKICKEARGYFDIVGEDGEAILTYQQYARKARLF